MKGERESVKGRQIITLATRGNVLHCELIHFWTISLIKNTFQRKKVINNETFIYGNILNILRYNIFFFINAKILIIANRLLKVMNFIVKFIVN